MIRSTFSPLMAVLLLITAAPGQQETIQAGTVEAGVTAITGSLADGASAEPVSKPASIEFRVNSTVTKRMHVVEAAEMSDLPPVKGTITTTVQLVDDPGLPDPPSASAALPVTDPTVLARMREMRQKYLTAQIAFVSATVYDHSRTYLRCHPNGRADKPICGWSNLDFMCFSGFGTFQVAGRDGKMRKYALLMSIGGIDTRQRSAFLAKHGRTFVAPTPPALSDLATGGPAFVITDGDTTDPESMALIEGMHDLYRAEGPLMEAAYVARVQAHAERKAYLLANPPVPQDVTVQFWKRNSPSPAGLQILDQQAVKP